MYSKPTKRVLTNQRQTDKFELDDGNDGQCDPQGWLDVQTQPEKALVGRADLTSLGISALKDPTAVARGLVDLVPPPQSHQSAPGNVLQVVEVGGKEDDGDDEDKDTVPWSSA